MITIPDVEEEDDDEDCDDDVTDEEVCNDDDVLDRDEVEVDCVADCWSVAASVATSLVKYVGSVS